MKEFVIKALFCGALLFLVVAAISSLFASEGGAASSAAFGVASLVIVLIGKAQFQKLLQEEGQGFAMSEWQPAFDIMCALVLVGALISGFQAVQISQAKKNALVAASALAP